MVSTEIRHICLLRQPKIINCFLGVYHKQSVFSRPQFLSLRENWGEKGEKQHSLLKAEGGSIDADERHSQKKQADIKIRQSATSILYCSK